MTSALRPLAAATARTLCTDLEAELGLRRSAMSKALKGQRERIVNTPDGKARQRLKERPPQEDPRESGRVARMATAPLRKRAADELVADYETKARALYKSTPGFVGALLLLDGEKRNARSITVWEWYARLASLHTPVAAHAACSDVDISDDRLSRASAARPTWTQRPSTRPTT